ncbi:MAG: nitrous oxide reductase accessory protein NosL [Desulfobulbaceae bacterium]|nr:nitrous oxide reductase accessory protein NosL [Desulfobulbaceae bacterium]
MFSQHVTSAIKCITFAACLTITLLFYQGATATQDVPQVIADDLVCGKCGMYPARYPQWQTQIIFNDGSMSAFDGSKCMFGFMNNMNEYDKVHTKDDIAKIWVRDFNSSEWLDAKSAHFVVGSDVMGPMGKELIPFQEQSAAESFQQEHGGQLAAFDSINMETLKPLMGKMQMQGKMMMEKGQMEK